MLRDVVYRVYKYDVSICAYNLAKLNLRVKKGLSIERSTQSHLKSLREGIIEIVGDQNAGSAVS